jgi:hypothetical protein
MYCGTCGRPNADDGIFCIQCGASLRGDAQQRASTDASYTYGSADAEPEGEASPYYTREFARLQAGWPARFNVAAFILGPFHTLYRGCTKRFCKLYLPYLVAKWMYFTYTLSLAYHLIANQYSEAAIRSMPGFFSMWIITVALWVWGVVLAIYNGATFNRAYYKQTGGNPARRTHTARAMALVGVLVVLYAGVVLKLGLAAYSQASKNYSTADNWYGQYGDGYWYEVPDDYWYSEGQTAEKPVAL